MINKKLKESEIFATQELSLAAALVSWGFNPTAVDKSNPKVTFIFLKSQSLNEAINSFWNNTGKVSPKNYFNSLREVKSRIYGE